MKRLERRPPNDVCSVLLDFVNNEIPETVKTLYIFSDKSTGQNNNNTSTKMLLALVSMKMFDKIVKISFYVRAHILAL